jgi:nucleotide-binding universal stress UspA family protein
MDRAGRLSRLATGEMMDVRIVELEGVEMFKTIVVATDGSESGDRAMSMAQQLASSSGARVLVTHVAELMVGRSAGYPVNLDEDEVRAKITNQVADLKAAGLDAEVKMHAVAVGGPAHLIADDAEAAGADLIVTGTRGHSPVAGLMLGSVTQRLLHIAPCPVLVVPPPRQER